MVNLIQMHAIVFMWLVTGYTKKLVEGLYESKINFSRNSRGLKAITQSAQNVFEVYNVLKQIKSNYWFKNMIRLVLNEGGYAS